MNEPTTNDAHGLRTRDEHADRGAARARAFLAKVEADEQLASRVAETDGHLPLIVSIAAEEGYSFTERELVAAYERHMREGGAMKDDGARLRDPGELGHPIVYLA